MSKNPHSDRVYIGKFGVEKIYPRYTLKDVGDGALGDAATVSFVLPFSEAVKLAKVILKVQNGNPKTVEMKVDRREEKRGKDTGLFPGTLTFSLKAHGPTSRSS